MTQDVNRDRLDQLREDLAALRARTTAELGLPEAREPAPPIPDPRLSPGQPPREAKAKPPREARAKPPRVARAKPPRPPRRPFSRPRVRKPAPHKVVPTPILVRRRPSYLAAPRWPQWGLISGLVAIGVGLPATWQLAYRLVQAMLDTAVPLASDPARSDFLHAAAGVAGGGLTLALAVGALAVVKGRPGYGAAAGGVIAVFCVFPYIAYTANAGVVAAPMPELDTMIRPPRWGMHTALALTFWLCAVALMAAIADLLVRSVHAVTRAIGSEMRARRRRQHSPAPRHTTDPRRTHGPQRTTDARRTPDPRSTPDARRTPDPRRRRTRVDRPADSRPRQTSVQREPDGLPRQPDDP